jgi:phosphoenolpyruvate-protein kinase (PTS system EI component)
VGLGVDELSLSPAGIPAIKSMIRGATKLRLETLARHALNPKNSHLSKKIAKWPV